jgi:hypothetical protein
LDIIAKDIGRLTSVEPHTVVAAIISAYPQRNNGRPIPNEIRVRCRAAGSFLDFDGGLA